MGEKRQFWKGVLAGLLTAAVVVSVAVSARGLAGRFLTGKAGADLDLTNSRVDKKIDEMDTLINRYYLDEIDKQQVEDYLYKGMVAGLGDPYAAYYTPKELETVMESNSGEYCGIGVQITQDMNTGIMTITQVFEGSPAEEAGIRAGDILYKVEGEEVTGKDLTETVGKVKGEENTKVHLTFIREGQEEDLEVDVERRMIETKTVSYEMLENRIGYIAITAFEEATTGQFQKALADLRQQGMEALVIDLRNNGGGLVSSVSAILDELLPEGLIVYTEDKYGKREEEKSDAEHFFDKPMAVLVNGYSASASEIFAGAIKDYGVGTLIGTKTFGKGIVQKIYPLENGGALKLTVSKYYTPKGNNIHGIGIEPDLTVELPEGIRMGAQIPEGQDTQLQKAVEILNEESSGQKDEK